LPALCAENATFSTDQAEGVADALSAAYPARLPPKQICANFPLRRTIKIGGMLVIAVGVLTALLKLS
jgi:hypothetical protein